MRGVFLNQFPSVSSKICSKKADILSRASSNATISVCAYLVRASGETPVMLSGRFLAEF
jgi:hypothetical protein